MLSLDRTSCLQVWFCISRDKIEHLVSSQHFTLLETRWLLSLQILFLKISCLWVWFIIFRDKINILSLVIILHCWQLLSLQIDFIKREKYCVSSNIKWWPETRYSILSLQMINHTQRQDIFRNENWRERSILSPAI